MTQGASIGPILPPAGSGGGGGSGTVTSVSVVSANGFAGTVATATTTPAITLSTTVTGILKGNGTTISAATAGTDYPATGVITAGGPTGSSTVVPVITWNANGQLTAVTTATITASAVSAMHNLVRTAVKTTTYAAAVGDLVPCDSTSGGFTVTLPTAPADQSLIEVKHIIQGTTSGTGNTITVAAGGSDVINRAAGPTSVTIPLNGQSRAFLYQSSTAIWTITWAELPQTVGSPDRVTAQSTTYAALAGDIVLATAGAGGFTITLPASTIGQQVIVKKVDAGAGTITISPTSGTIDGSATATIVTRYVSLTFVADGTNWNII